MKWPSHGFFIYMRIQQNIGEVKKIYEIEVKLQQWVYVSRKWLFTRCENSSQNLGCSKTSTSNTCLTNQMAYSQVLYIHGSLTEHCKGEENILDRNETSAEGLSSIKFAFH